MFEGRWRMKGNSTLTTMLEALDGKLSLQELSVRIASLCRDFFEAGILLGGGVESEKQEEAKLTKEQLLTIRAANFSNRLTTPEYIMKYGEQMISDFIDYWTEPNPSHTKLRFEMQKVFDVNRRLARWARNNYNRYDRQQPTVEEQRRDKLASILTDE